MIAVVKAEKQCTMFLAAGQLSKIMDSEGFNSCPDLHSAINCTANASTLNNCNAYELKLQEVSRAHASKGELEEVELKDSDFDTDEDPDNKVSNLTCTP